MYKTCFLQFSKWVGVMKVIRIRIENDLYELLRSRIPKGELSARIRKLIEKHIDELIENRKSYG